jgi:hypothetical protein
MSKAGVNSAISRAKAVPGGIRAIIKNTKPDTATYLAKLDQLMSQRYS